MEELLVGLDICDYYTKVSLVRQEIVLDFPTVICKNKQKDIWLIGEEAYASALRGEGVLVDKLLKLMSKGGTSTIGGVRYDGTDLMSRFLECVLARTMETVDAAGNEADNASDGEAGGEAGDAMAEEESDDLEADAGILEAAAAMSPEEEAETVDGGNQAVYESSRIGQIVITIPKVSSSLMNSLVICADNLQIPRKRFHIVSHTESFLYYVLAQKREVWNNQVGMFDLSRDFLGYYEMKVQRGMRHVTVMGEREKLDEGFNLDILNSPTSVKLADKILCACGERFLQKKLFSSIFLTGEGFQTQDWAPEFMKLVCSRRKVYGEQALFAHGAACKAADLVREKTAYPYTMICDGRLDATVAINIQHRDQDSQLVLASAGDNWYESRATLELILDNQQYIEFSIAPVDPRRNKTVKLTLEGFPERDDKTLRVQLDVEFLDENTMTVVVKDMGFGEFYPSTGAVIRQEVML